MNEDHEKILEHLVCPVCLVYPEKEGFQCRNGHIICSFCIQPLGNCPQCETPFEVPPIRCRLVESILDHASLPCVNKDAGCTQHFSRKGWFDHLKTCEFRSVSLCKWMGFTCNFEASAVEPLINHLKSHHSAKIGKIKSNLVWRNFEKKCDGRVAPFHGIFMPEYRVNSETSEKTQFIFLITLTVEPNEENLFSFVPIHLHDGRCSADYLVNLDVFSGDVEMIQTRLVYKWAGLASNYKDSEGDILYPSFRLTTSYIKKQALKFGNLNEFTLSMNFSVKATPAPNSSIEEDDENSSH